ncbi:MAG: glycosyltransferase family 4 protein [bacterium]|nr:glycosyltransferase family 4 protein [bacterium]
MKIAMIGAKGLPATIGGVERHVEELSTRLVKSGCEVTVYARPWYTGRSSWSVRMYHGVRLVALPSFVTKHLDAISHVFLATLHAMRDRYDVYHFHGVGPALFAFLPRVFRPRSRVIVTFHCVDRHHAKWGWFARAMLTAGEWAACRFPHETITVGETLQAYCGGRYGQTTTCIPNGVSSGVRCQVSGVEARAALASFGLSPKRYLLVVSRLVPHKGVHTIVTAFRHLKRERSDLRDLQLAIVGAPAFTDAYRDELVILAAGDPHIRFLGQQTGATLDALYSNCLAFVHASASEGLPIVLLEAAAAGVLPVVSDIPEHREVINRVGGMLFRVGDVWDCASTLDVVVRSANSLPRIGAAIRSAVLKHYDWDAAVTRTRACYRSSPPKWIRQRFSWSPS